MRWRQLLLLRDLNWVGWSALILVAFPTAFATPFFDGHGEAAFDEPTPRVSSSFPGGSTHPEISVPAIEKAASASTDTPLQPDDLRSETSVNRAILSPST